MRQRKLLLVISILFGGMGLIFGQTIFANPYGEGPDLNVTQNDSADPLMPGDLFTYTVNISNTGTGVASQVVLTDTLPADVSLTASTVSLEGNVLRYHFEETSGDAIDSSGNGLDGTLISNPTRGIAGPVNNAYEFDGVDDYILAGGAVNSIFDMDDEITMAAWVYPVAGNGFIFNRDGEYQLQYVTEGEVWYAIANTTPNWTAVNSGVSIPTNDWSHIVFTYDANAGSDQIKLFVDGVLAHTNSGSGPIGDFPVHGSQDELRIGGRQSVVATFDGRLDEVYLFNRAIKAQEVQALYTSVNGIGTCSGTPLVCQLGALPAGQSAEVNLNVTISETPSTLLTNTVVVGSAETDTNPTDNTATETTNVNIPTAIHLQTVGQNNQTLVVGWLVATVFVLLGITMLFMRKRPI